MGCGSSKSSDAQDNDKKPDDKAGEENKDGAADGNKDGEQEKKEGEDAEAQEKRDKFGKEAIEAHNKYRAKHGAPEMTLNPELSEIAQKWADHLAAEKAFEHSKTDDRKCSKGATGENLFYSGSTGEIEMNGEAAVESWYNEIKDYDFEKPGFAMNTGHFTQVVWQGSTEFGFGFATYQDGEFTKLVVVGNYYPAGNIMKQFEDNVKPAKGEDCDKKSEKKEKPEKAEKKDDKKEEPAKKPKKSKGK